MQRLRRADQLRAGAQIADRDLGDVSEQFVAVPADAADFAAIRDAEQIGMFGVKLVAEVDARLVARVDGKLRVDGAETYGYDRDESFGTLAAR